MCASSRMVVKRKGAPQTAVLACTLIPYDERFELGSTLGQAAKLVALNHPHCAKFCVLGGGACSATSSKSGTTPIVDFREADVQLSKVL